MDPPAVTLPNARESSAIAIALCSVHRPTYPGRHAWSRPTESAAPAAQPDRMPSIKRNGASGTAKQDVDGRYSSNTARSAGDRNTKYTGQRGQLLQEERLPLLEGLQQFDAKWSGDEVSIQEASMNIRRVLVASVLMGLGSLTGFLLGASHPALAQKFDAAYQAGTYQISAGNQNESWRVNTSTGETHHCSGGQGGVICRRAEFK